MPNVKNIIHYIGHYGLKSAFGLAREKLFIDSRRFDPEKERPLPSFPIEYNKKELKKLEREKNKPLNLLYLIHYFYPNKKGGTERFTLNLMKAVEKLGNKPTLLLLEANEPKKIYTHKHGNMLYRYYEYDGIKCIAFRHKKAPLGLYYKDVRLDDAEMAEFAEFIIKELRIDVVHAAYPQPFASFLHRCYAIGIPYVVTCTDFCMMCHYSTMVDNTGAFCAGTEGQTKCERVCSTYACKSFKARYENAREVLSGAAAVTVPSEFVARVLSKEFPTVPFLPVAHGLSDAFEYKQRTKKVRKFVYAGTLTPLKGVHLLISAFTSLTDADITLDIYGDGDGSYVKKLKALLDSRVKLHGAVSGDKMPAIYRDADCVIIPSMWYETYNFVLREALMTGALVLAANIGAMPEAIDEGKNGFLFMPSSLDSLTDALKKALDFDFSRYEIRSFPKTLDEGKIYNGIYQSTV